MMKYACVATGLLMFVGSVQAQDVSPESRPVIDLAPHPYDGKRAVAVFHGVTGHQVHTTSDGGGTWTRWAGFPSFAYAERLFVHPGQPNVVYVKQAARPLRDFPFGAFVRVQGGPLYKSVDFGQTWTVAAQDADQPVEGYKARVVTPAAADPADPLRLFGTKRRPFGCTSLGCFALEGELSLHESRDGGVTWSEPLFDGGPSGIYRVSYPNPAAPGRFFLTTRSFEAHLSIDAGRTWSRFATAFTHTPFWVEQDPHDARILYASGTVTDGSHNIIARSDDGGHSWDAIYEFAPLEWNIGALTPDPYRPGRVWLSVHTGLMRSDDRGTTWTHLGFGAGGRSVGNPGERLRVSKVTPNPAEDVQAYLTVDSLLSRANLPPTPRVAVEYQYDDRYWTSLDRGETVSQDYRAYEAVRTGQRFGLFSRQDAPAGAVGLCRFQGNPARQQSSRFIALQGAECEIVKSGPEFELEAENEHYAVAPDLAGGCSNGLVPVQRFNNLQANVNHRYVADPTVAQQMRNRGWYDEGVRFCARPMGSGE